MSEVVATLTRVLGNNIYSPSSEKDKSKNKNDVTSQDLIQNLPHEVELQQRRYVLGRGKDADIIMSIRVNKKEVISRAHAEISCTNNKVFFVKDLNSVNGVFVSGERIESQMLYDGDIIQFGGMAKMPLGKKLKEKQSAENVQYQFHYKHEVPHILRFSAPPSTSTRTPPSSIKDAREGGESSPYDTTIHMKDPFKSGTQAMAGSGVVTSAIYPSVATATAAVTATTATESTSNSSSVSSKRRQQGVGAGVTGTETGHSRQQEPEKRQRVKPQDTQEENDIRKQQTQQQQQSEAELQAVQQKYERLQAAYQQMESTSKSRGEQLQQKLITHNEAVANKEKEWSERVNFLEMALQGAKRDLQEKLILIAKFEKDSEGREGEYADSIATLKQYSKEEKRKLTEQLKLAHSQHIAKQKSEYMENTRLLEVRIQETNQQQEQQLSVTSQLEQQLEDKVAEIQQLHTSVQQAGQARDEVWVDKMNTLLQTAADDTRAYKAQILQLRDQLGRTQEALGCSQEQVATLQTTAAATTTTTTTAAGGGKRTASSSTTAAVTVAVAVADGTCTIGVDALREYIMCALCQQPMLDAVVCRCSHGFCHACLEVFIRNQSEKTNSDRSKYAIHKTIAAIKAGNVSGIRASTADTSSDPYATFTCPVCHHDDDDHDEQAGGGRASSSSSSGSAARVGRVPPYFRSENLDSIIYLCQQACSRADREAFEQREATNFHLLKTLGIDPMASAGDSGNMLGGNLPPGGSSSGNRRGVDDSDVNNNNNNNNNNKTHGGGMESDSDNDSAAYGNYNDEEDDVGHSDGCGSESGGY